MPIRRQRFKCKKCGSLFVRKDITFKKKISIDMRLKIVRLYKTPKNYISIYDPLRKKTYSTREIAKMLDISKSAVHKIVNEKL